MKATRILVLTLFLTLVAIVSFGQADFDLAPGSPEIPPITPSDILNSQGTNVVVKATQLGLDPAVNIDAFSYGVDRIEPLGPNFYVAVQYSVTTRTKGLISDRRPGAGAVRLQAMGNGVGGDKYFLKAILGPPAVGMFPIARGLVSDAPMHNLTPRTGNVESELDGLSMSSGRSEHGAIYFSVDWNGVPGRNWGPADIIRVVPGSQPRLWIGGNSLGLRPGDDIDALAIWNTRRERLDARDVIYISLRSGSPTRSILTNGAEAVFQVWPRPMRVVFDSRILNLTSLPEEDLDALTGFDPGPPTDEILERPIQTRLRPN